MPRSLRFVLLLLLAGPAFAQQSDDYVRIPFNVSIWRDISIGDAIAGDTSRKVLHHVSLNLPYGQADRLEGIAVGWLATVYEESAYGLQAAGLANVAGGDAAAIQVAGLANIVGERMRGVQAAGLANVVGESGGYVQAAGLANVAGENFHGLQAAGLANVIGDEAAAIQVAGVTNVAAEDFRGIQASGLANMAGEDLRGIQVSGLANISGEDMEGGQFAGLANIAGETLHGVQAASLANISGDDVLGLQAALFNVVGGTLHGVQVGVVNVASKSAGLQVGVVTVAGEQRGIPIGLYSRTGGVPVRLDVWTDETAALHVGVRSGSATVSNYVGVSARPFSGVPFRWGVFAGLGVEQPFAAGTSWGLDAFVHGLFSEDFGGVGGTLVRLRAILTQEVGERVAVFGGPAFSLFLSDDYSGDDLAPFSVYDSVPRSSRDAGDVFVRAWPGLEAGLRFRITND